MQYSFIGLADMMRSGSVGIICGSGLGGQAVYTLKHLTWHLLPIYIELN